MDARTPLGSVENWNVDLGFIDFDVNLLDINLEKLEEKSQPCDLISLKPDTFALNICNLAVNITTSEYNLMSNPPLFTDIGDNFFALKDINLEVESSLTQDESHNLAINFKKLGFYLDYDFKIYGISDMAKVVENTVHWIIDLIVGRAKNAATHKLEMIEE